MRWILRVLIYCLSSLLALVVVAGALLGYFVYTPDPQPPALSGALAKGRVVVVGVQRSYLTYVPRGLQPGAPLVLVLHGSGESAAQIRVGTGYGFERLADERRFAVVYPNARSFDWNDCSRVGDFSVDGAEVDDVGFLGVLVDKLVAEIGADRGRVFATGVSSGGFMAMRLALEAPTRFRAVAAVAANVPAPENFKCQPAGPGVSVMIMNGTQDPLVPFAGGEVNLLGLFYKSGNVRSSTASGQYFADLNHIAGAPASQRSTVADAAGVGWDVAQTLWRNDGRAEVELVAIQGGGHGLPQPTTRRPRLLGPSPMAPDGPAMIWAFFDRQRR